MSVLSVPLRACEISRSVSKAVNNFFHYGLHLRPKKKATHTAEMMYISCVAIFWVVSASSGEKSCLQFSIPTGLKRKLDTIENHMGATEPAL